MTPTKNTYRSRASFVEMILVTPRRRRYVAKISHESLAVVQARAWRVSVSGAGKARLQSGRGKDAVYLSRLLLDAPAGLDVDHINGDTLDNRLTNLRIVTHAENLQNSKLFKSNTSGHRGISWDRQKQRWVARGRADGRLVTVGRFLILDEAVAAMSAWRKANHPNARGEHVVTLQSRDEQATASGRDPP